MTITTSEVGPAPSDQPPDPLARHHSRGSVNAALLQKRQPPCPRAGHRARAKCHARHTGRRPAPAAVDPHGTKRAQGHQAGSKSCSKAITTQNMANRKKKGHRKSSEDRRGLSLRCPIQECHRPPKPHSTSAEPFACRSWEMRDMACSTVSWLRRAGVLFTASRARVRLTVSIRTLEPRSMEFA